MPERLKIEFRQMQLTYDLNEDGSEENVVVAWDEVNKIAKYVAGNVQDHVWRDMTDYTQGLDKLGLTWDKVNQGSNNAETNKGGTNYDKGITASLVFDSKAFQYIWDWLLTESWQILNAVEVRITDQICGKAYRTFEIKVDNIAYSPEDECFFEITLREQDLKWHAVHKTAIFDNWQNWFTQDGTKDHPMFLTCIEPRPRLLNSVRIGVHIFLRSIPVIGQIFLPNEDDDKFRELANIDRFVAAPLVRDYISNVCDKFGIAIDTIFHDPEGAYYNVCVYHPVSGYWVHNSSSAVQSTDLRFNFENRWLITLADFLDSLRPVFEAEWYVTPNNTLVFKPTKDLLDLDIIYDFTTPGALVLDNLKYTFNGDKKPAYGRYQYTVDGSDLASQEIQALYNDLVDYDGPANNPMLEGELNKVNQFAPTAFVRDGRTANFIRELASDGETVGYILVGMLGVIVAALAAGVLTVGASVGLLAFAILWVAVIGTTANHLRDISDQEEYRGAVRLIAEQTLSPRLLLWDGESMSRAKVVKTQDPDPNTYYNPDSKDYTTVNNLNQGNNDGYVFNYPMYFESMFKDNLYDRYHDSIDNPLKSLENNQEFTFDSDLCCELLELLGCFDGEFTRIGYLIKIEDRKNYEVFGRIENVNVQYDTNNVTIKGKVIKKKK